MRRTQPRRIRFNIPNISLPSWQTLKLIHPAWLVIIGLLLMLMASYQLPQFKIQTINCQLDAKPCDAAVMSELEQYRLRQFFLVPVAYIESKLADSVTNAVGVNVEVANPTTLSISLVSAKPIAILRTAEPSADLVINSNFKVTHIGGFENQLPLVYYPGFTISETQTLDQDPTMQFIVNLLTLLQQSQSQPGEVRVIVPQEIELLYPDNHLVLVSSTQSLSRQLTTLQLFLAEATMWKDFPVLDVRYEKPVLKPTR